MLLHITEIHDLRVERVGNTVDDRVVYRASARPGRGESHQEARWFEVSLSGKGWDEMLAEEVEVGGERKFRDAGWREGVEEVVTAAGGVVRGMDGVGGWNGNPFGELFRELERRRREGMGSGGKGGSVRVG